MKDILELSQIDPDVLAVQKAVRRLVKAISLNMDPLMKNVVEVDGSDIIDFERWIKNRSKAKKMVQMLHEAKAPELSRN